MQFLGFSYERINATPPEGSFYYTGEQYDGRRIYVAASDKKPDNVPDHIFLRDGDHYAAYAISGKPAVYAYVPCGAFNTNETVRPGVANAGPVSVDLPNAAPYEIRRNESGTWRTIYSPVAAQVITRLADGRRLTWQWDQRLDDGSLAPFGDYEVVIAGKYVAPFRLAGDTPVVEAYDAGVDRAGVDVLAASSPALEAFRMAYPDPSASAKEDVVSIMQYKAWALGLDPESLRKAIVAAGDGLPCIAVHASYEGRPGLDRSLQPGVRLFRVRRSHRRRRHGSGRLKTSGRVLPFPAFYLTGYSQVRPRFPVDGRLPGCLPGKVVYKVYIPASLSLFKY